MELRVLKYFLVVAQERNISKAANILHITQPTLSRQLKELENELGVILFVRGNRKITLTEDGMFLQKRAEEIISLTEKTEVEIKVPNQALNGTIYIGGGETHVMKYLAKTMKNVQKKHPLIKFNLYSGNADDVIEKLDKGLIDFGIIISPANIDKYDSLELPGHDTWGILMHKDSPLSHKDSISPVDLMKEPLICSVQSFVHTKISNWFHKDYDSLNIVANYNLIYNASLLVEEKIGYAIGLKDLINTSGNSNLCFIPLKPKLESSLNIIWKKHQVFSKTNEVFLKELISTINNIHE